MPAIATKRSKGIRTSRRRSGKGEDNCYKIGKVILTRRRYDCNKDRKSDIDEAKRRGEEYHREVNRRGEENCNKEKDKTITKRRYALILMVKEN